MRVLATVLLLLLGISIWWMAPVGAAIASAVERRHNRPQLSDAWTWHLRIFSVACLAAALLVGLGIVRVGRG